LNTPYDSRFPSIDDLRARARRRVPRFIFEFLDGGCNEHINLRKNTDQIRDVELRPVYVREKGESSLGTELFGRSYDAPFGVAPIGLQGLIWPGAAEVLARSAVAENLPFILSTCSTASIERIGEITAGEFWFQLYNPVDPAMRNDILDRAAAAGCRILVLLADVPTFGFRYHDIRNGLAVPPALNVRTVLEMAGSPTWALETLRYGQPTFATLKKYMPAGLDMKQLGLFMNKTFSGKLTPEMLATIRDRWKGKLVLKGVATEEDAGVAVKLGLDGIIVSNHGGRQLDAGQSAIHSLVPIVRRFAGQIKILFDSGIRSGPDIARVLASGAEFVFLGRGFMYGVAALGKTGGRHTISILKTQLKQVMDQVGCDRIEDLPRHLVRNHGSASLSEPLAVQARSASGESESGNSSRGRS
jgi:L-lactate dehydrogenase (cytochrome)